MRQPRLSSSVLQKYGLKAQPFELPEECEEIYRNTSSDMLINSIRQQLLSSDMIQLVIGEYRSGKTCFCRRLMCESPPELVIHYYSAHAKSLINNLFKALLVDADIDDIGDARTLAVQAAKRMFRQLRDNRQPVLLIDNAHSLKAPVLRMLFRFIDAVGKQDRGKVKLVLVGERDLQEKWHALDNAAPADENVATSLLRPLNRQEVAGFLEFRFASVGAGAHPFSDKQLQSIQRESSGLPGKIEQMAADILGGSESRPRKFLSPGPLAATAAAVIAVALIPVFISGRPDKNVTETSSSSVETLSKPSRVNQQQSEPAETAPLEHTEVIQPDTASSPAEVAGPETGKTSDALTFVDTPGVDTAPDAGVLPVEENTVTTGSGEYVANTLKDTDWLKQWPDDYYVIQLAGSWQPDNLMQLAGTLSLEKDLVFHSSERNGETWYTLLYGVFPDRGAAREAIAQLPPEVRQTQPWPRPVSTLLRNQR